MKICFVEDNDAILAHLRRLAGELAGACVVGEARDQNRALEIVRDAAPDVLILDLKLAAGSGIGVLRGVARFEPRPRVVVLTNSSDTPYRDRCMALGADVFLDKTREFEQLPGVLAELANTLAAPPGEAPGPLSRQRTS